MYIYEEKLKEKNIKIIPLETYKGSQVKILHKCVCGTEWKIRPNNILNGQTCMECAKRNNSLSKLKDNSFYLKKLNENNIKVIPLEEYRGINTNILHRCSCGNEWELSPHAVLKGNKCGCGGGKQRTHEDYITLLKEKDIKVKPLEEYIKNTIKILHKCTCNENWLVTPKIVLGGSRCNLCKGNKLKLYKDRPTILYYIKIDGVYKIGITLLDKRRSVESNILRKRFSQDIRNGREIEILHSKVYEDGSIAYTNEQKILNKNEKHKYKGKDMIISGNTELFNIDISERINNDF